MSEEWKAIEGYEGYYEVSNHGRVRSLNRRIKFKNSTRLIKGKILLQKIESSSRSKKYKRYSVNLSKNGIHKTYKVHILVAKAFIPNDNLSYNLVLHGPNGSLNNNVNNLYWGDHFINSEDKNRDGTNFQKNKTHCPFGGEYIGWNISSAKVKKGYRDCRSCNITRCWLRNHDGDFQTIHDLCIEYELTPHKLYKRKIISI